jgi:hypothetical protein
MPFRRFGRPGLLGAVARTAVVAGTASMTMNAMNRRAAQRNAGQQALAEQEASQNVGAVAPPDSDDLVDQLTRLGELRDSGVLTADELVAAKAKLLNA